MHYIELIKIKELPSQQKGKRMCIKYPCACGTILSILHNECLEGVSNLESAILSLADPLESPLALEKGATNWKMSKDVALDIHSGAYTTTKCTSWSG